MAGHNYMNRGYTDDQNKANYGGFECSDHVCRPIIVDTEGRKRPIISYTPNHHGSESYVTSTETIVDHTPVVVTTEYQYSTTATKVEPLEDYGVTTTNKWRRPSSPVLDRPQVMVTEYGYSSPTEVEPRNNYGVTNDKWHRPSSSVHDRPQVGLRDSSPTKVQPVQDYYGVSNDKWRRPSSPIRDHPQVMATKYGYNSPTKVEPLNNYGVANDKWRRPSSPVDQYGYSSPTKVEPVKDYGVTNDKWRRPSSPVHEYGYHSPTKIEPTKDYGVANNKWQRHSSPVHEYGYSSPTKVEPGKDYGVTNDKWRRPSSPVHEYGYNSPKKVEPMDYRVTNDNWHRPSSPVQDRPQKVEEFITSIQTEVGRPTRSGLLRAPNWCNNTPNSKIGQVGNIGYDDYTNYNDNDDWNKPNVNTIRDESLADPFIANRDARERPSRNGTWLSGPTNDIGKAVEILKEAVKPLSVTGTAQPTPTPQPRMTVPVSTIPKSDTYTETIDSREAERRYRKLDQSSRPFQKEENYTGTINSREAALKYKGAILR
ncbi:hypothetical protein ACSBR2_017817 [Camellia fascicularis]